MVLFSPSMRWTGIRQHKLDTYSGSKCEFSGVHRSHTHHQGTGTEADRPSAQEASSQQEEQAHQACAEGHREGRARAQRGRLHPAGQVRRRSRMAQEQASGAREGADHERLQLDEARRQARSEPQAEAVRPDPLGSRATAHSRRRRDKQSKASAAQGSRSLQPENLSRLRATNLLRGSYFLKSKQTELIQ